MGKVTLKDLADELGISTAAVSKALRGQKGVSEDLRQQVVDLAGKKGYEIRSHEAETLFYKVSVLVPERFVSSGQSFYWALYQELAREARYLRINLYLEVVDAEAEDHCALPAAGLPGNAQAAVVMGAFHSPYKRMLTERLRLPLVWLDTETRTQGADIVVSDNIEGGFFMAEYLLERGHREIGYFGTLLQTESIDNRYLGFCKALLLHGIDPQKDHRFPDRTADGRTFGAEKINELLPAKLPTAFFCNCDSSADRLIEALALRGLSVPGDISVVGFDNFSGHPGTEGQVTTWAIDIRAMARRTIHILSHQLAKESYSPGKFILPGHLIERDSVKTIGPAIPSLV